MLNSHMWLVVTISDTVDIEHYIIQKTAHGSIATCPRTYGELLEAYINLHHDRYATRLMFPEIPLPGTPCSYLQKLRLCSVLVTS